MERIRIRHLAFGLVALAGLALLPMAAKDADAGAARPPAAENLQADLPHMKVLPALLPNSKENTNAIAQNNGTAASTIAMDIYTPGACWSRASQVFTNVPVGGTRVFIQALNLGLAPGFRGVGVLSSDQPFDAVLARDIENNSTFAKSYSIHNAYAAGGNVVTLPTSRTTWRAPLTRASLSRTQATRSPASWSPTRSMAAAGSPTTGRGGAAAAPVTPSPSAAR
jgi:hypothetical protein